MTWRLHIETIEAKPFRTFIRIYSLFKSERLNANNILTLKKALIRSSLRNCSFLSLLTAEKNNVGQTFLNNLRIKLFIVFDWQQSTGKMIVRFSINNLDMFL
jgi:hypothetical protein